MQANQQSRQLMHAFEALFRGHAEVLERHSTLAGAHTELADFIAGFVEAQKRSDDIAHKALPVVTATFEGYLAGRRKWEERQRLLAEDFNLFDVMDVQDDEVRHSMVLAWVLDSRLAHGTHAQGNLGFRLFLEEFKGELKLNHSISDVPYWVRREVSCGESRVDIEIAARDKFIIHIENKIWSAEGDNQTEREWRGLKERAEELKIPGENTHGIFLTRDASAPVSPEFHAVGWSRIARVFEKFAEQAGPAEVRLFTAHYAKAVRRFALTEPKPTEIENGEATV